MALSSLRQISYCRALLNVASLTSRCFRMVCHNAELPWKQLSNPSNNNDLYFYFEYQNDLFGYQKKELFKYQKICSNTKKICSNTKTDLFEYQKDLYKFQNRSVQMLKRSVRMPKKICSNTKKYLFNIEICRYFSLLPLSVKMSPNVADGSYLWMCRCK